MKIKFSLSISTDLIIIELLGASIWLEFFPVWCWVWEWQFYKGGYLWAYTIETPTMSIAVKHMFKAGKHED